MTCAMILCAGFGTRLNELTKNSPKPMLKIGDKPILEHTILNLKRAGITVFVINLHYLADHITSHFGDGSSLGVKIHYSYENEPLGTAGAVKKVESLLSVHDNFLVIYGDIVTNQDFSQLLQFHSSEKKALGSIILHERAKSNSIVEIDENNKITNFIERPNEEQLMQKKQNWVNSGLYCFSKEILSRIPEGKSDFPKEIFPELVGEGLLYGFPLQGYRVAIDTPERYYMVQSDYEENSQLL